MKSNESFRCSDPRHFDIIEELTRKNKEHLRRIKELEERLDIAENPWRVCEDAMVWALSNPGRVLDCSNAHVYFKFDHGRFWVMSRRGEDPLTTQPWKPSAGFSGCNRPIEGTW